MGNGIHSKKLNENDWLKFNSVIRSHQNYLESISMITTITAISGKNFGELILGIFYPIAASVLGLGYMVGRQVYASGYKVEPKQRQTGAMIHILSALCLLILSVYGTVNTFFL
jgi:hypothetical protein